MTTYIGHTSESSKADIARNRARASLQSVIVEDYGFAAAASGATNRQAILDAVGAACGYQDAAAMDADRPAASLRRDALKRIVLPAYEAELDTFPEIKSVWFLTVEAAGKDSTILNVTGGDATTPIECGLKLNGVGYSVFRGFRLNIAGDATYGLYGLWDNTTSAASFSAVKFYDVAVEGKFRTAGVKIGKPLSTLQEDQTAWYSCRVVGGGSADATYWQAGFHLGTGAHGNNLIHMLYDVAAIKLKRGAYSDAAGVMIYGGILQSNGVDCYVGSPADYFEVSGIRSEQSTRFLQSGTPFTTPMNAVVRSCTYHAQKLNTDGRFIDWSESGTLDVSAMRVLDVPTGITATIRCGANTKPVTVTTRGLAVEGTAVENAVTADVPSLVTVIHAGYDEVADDGSITAHTHHALMGAGKPVYGALGVAPDVNLYRSAADTLKTDDNLVVAGGTVTVGTSALTGTQVTDLTDGGDTTLHGHSLSKITGGTATGSGYTLPDLAVTGGAAVGGNVSADTATVTSDVTARRIIVGEAVNTRGGRVQYKDDGGTTRWQVGLLAAGGDRDLAIYDLVNLAARLLVNSTTGVVSAPSGLTAGGALKHTGSTAGFFSVTPAARPAALVQTYSAADRTLGAYTPDAESTAYTGQDNAQAGSVYAKLADLNALRTAYENLRAFVEDLAQHHNALVDDLQTLGLEQ